MRERTMADEFGPPPEGHGWHACGNPDCEWCARIVSPEVLEANRRTRAAFDAGEPDEPWVYMGQDSGGACPVDGTHLALCAPITRESAWWRCPQGHRFSWCHMTRVKNPPPRAEVSRG